MASRLVLTVMRISALLLFLATALGLGAPASAAVAVEAAGPMAGSGEGCSAPLFDAGCHLLCRQAPAGTNAHHQLAAKPPPTCVNTAAWSGTPVVARRDARSPIPSVGIGPPDYLRFLRLLL